MNIQKLSKGFTIIEVVLVLAIGGLIFLMVFVALPALQAGQRDSARKNDVSIVSTAVTNFISNNRGNFPSVTQLKAYVQGLSADSDISLMTVSTTADTTATGVSLKEGQISVYKAAICDAQQPTATDASGNKVARYSLRKGANRQFAILTYMEGGGGVGYCLQGN